MDDKLGNRMIKEPVPGNTPQSYLQPGPSSWLLVVSSLLLSSCLTAIQWTGINLSFAQQPTMPTTCWVFSVWIRQLSGAFEHINSIFITTLERWLFLSSFAGEMKGSVSSCPKLIVARSYFLTMTQWCINIKFHLLSMASMSRFPPLSPCVGPCSVKGLNLPPPSIFCFLFSASSSVSSFCLKYLASAQSEVFQLFFRIKNYLLDSGNFSDSSQSWEILLWHP